MVFFVPKKTKNYVQGWSLSCDCVFAFVIVVFAFVFVIVVSASVFVIVVSALLPQIPILFLAKCFTINTIITEIIITPTTIAPMIISIAFKSIGGISVGLLDILDVTFTGLVTGLVTVDAGLVGDMVFPVDNGLFV